MPLGFHFWFRKEPSLAQNMKSRIDFNLFIFQEIIINKRRFDNYKNRIILGRYSYIERVIIFILIISKS